MTVPRTLGLARSLMVLPSSLLSEHPDAVNDKQGASDGQWAQSAVSWTLRSDPEM